jgi:hypothetical protein
MSTTLPTNDPLTQYRSLNQDLINFHRERAAYLKEIDQKASFAHLLAADAHQRVVSQVHPSLAHGTEAFEASIAAFDADNAIKERQEATIEDQDHDTVLGDSDKEPIALALTEEQARLLISAEYPNDIRAQTTALYDVVVQGKSVDVMNESVALDYEHNIKQFYVALDRSERPSLEQKLNLLVAENRKAVQPKAREITRASKEPVRDAERE